MDYRVCEIEWALEDSGILVGAQAAQAFNLKNKGVGTMALSRYEQFYKRLNAAPQSNERLLYL